MLRAEREKAVNAVRSLTEGAARHGLTGAHASGLESFLTRAENLNMEIRTEKDSTETRDVASAVRRVEELDADIRGFEEREQRGALADELRSAAENRGVPLDGRGAASASVALTGEHRHGEWVASEFRAGELLSTIGSGGLTPSQRATRFVDLLTPATAFLSSGVQKVYIPDGYDSYDLPVINTDHAAAWAAEGTDMSTTGFTGSVLPVVPKKVAALAYLSDELVGDSSPSVLNEVGKSMVRSIGLRIDTAAFAATTANGPGGLAGVSGVWNVDAGANGALLTNLDTVADAAGKVLGAGAADPVIVLHPDLWSLLTRLKAETGSNVPLVSATTGVAGGIERRILGYPVYLSKQISLTEALGSSGNVTTSIWVYDPSQVYAVFRQPGDFPIIENDRGLSRFREGLTGLRAITRVGFGFPVPEAIARVRGVKLV